MLSREIIEKIKKYFQASGAAELPPCLPQKLKIILTRDFTNCFEPCCKPRISKNILNRVANPCFKIGLKSPISN